MSADIYTKSFNVKANWVQAQRLINIFHPDELTAQGLYDWMAQREQLANIPAEDVDDDKESVLSFSTWDPMKESFENKEFNSYHPNHDANYNRWDKNGLSYYLENNPTNIPPKLVSK